MTLNCREQLLVRSVAIAAAVPGIIKSMRNALSVSDSAMPAYNIFDGDEEAPPERQPRAGRPGALIAVSLIPEFVLMLQARTDEVGTELTQHLARLQKAVLLDSQLLSLVGSNGAVRYVNCETDLGQGRKKQGAMLVRFAYDYFVDPKTL